MRALRPSRAVAVSLRGGLAAAGGSGAGVPVAKADPGATPHMRDAPVDAVGPGSRAPFTPPRSARRPAKTQRA